MLDDDHTGRCDLSYRARFQLAGPKAAGDCLEPAPYRV
jgi:hypothetical protein